MQRTVDGDALLTHNALVAPPNVLSRHISACASIPLFSRAQTQHMCRRVTHVDLCCKAEIVRPAQQRVTTSNARPGISLMRAEVGLIFNCSVLFDNGGCRRGGGVVQRVWCRRACPTRCRSTEQTSPNTTYIGRFGLAPVLSPVL